MKTIDVLYVVDDDETYQFLSQKVLEASKVVKKVMTFNNGAEAIDFLKKVKDNAEELPEVILLDLFMPVMDGWHFLDEFKNIKHCLNKKIIIYIVSSSIDPIDIRRAERISEVSDFIIKPLTKDKLLKVIEAIAP